MESAFGEAWFLFFLRRGFFFPVIRLSQKSQPEAAWPKLPPFPVAAELVPGVRSRDTFSILASRLEAWIWGGENNGDAVWHDSLLDRGLRLCILPALFGLLSSYFVSSLLIWRSKLLAPAAAFARCMI